MPTQASRRRSTCSFTMGPPGHPPFVGWSRLGNRAPLCPASESLPCPRRAGRATQTQCWGEDVPGKLVRKPRGEELTARVEAVEAFAADAVAGLAAQQRAMEGLDARIANLERAREIWSTMTYVRDAVIDEKALVSVVLAHPEPEPVLPAHRIGSGRSRTRTGSCRGRRRKRRRHVRDSQGIRRRAHPLLPHDASWRDGDAQPATRTGVGRLRRLHRRRERYAR